MLFYIPETSWVLLKSLKSSFLLCFVFAGCRLILTRYHEALSIAFLLRVCVSRDFRLFPSLSFSHFAFIGSLLSNTRHCGSSLIILRSNLFLLFKLTSRRYQFRHRLWSFRLFRPWFHTLIHRSSIFCHWKYHQLSFRCSLSFLTTSPSSAVDSRVSLCFDTMTISVLPSS